MIINKLQKNSQLPWELLLSADPNRNKVEKYLQEGQIYGAKLENEIIGVFVLLEISPLEVEIINIAVSEQYQGKGIAKQLIFNAIEQSTQQNYQKIWIGTGNSSIGQLALYQKCGFELSHIEKDFFLLNYSEPIFENGIQCKDMIRLVKKL